MNLSMQCDEGAGRGEPRLDSPKKRGRINEEHGLLCEGAHHLGCGDSLRSFFCCRRFRFSREGHYVEKNLEGKTMNQDRHRHLLRMITASVLIGCCYVLSPILRVPGMAPVQHIFNVIGAVLLGPWYNLADALIVSFLRMTTMGVTFLAITGSVFGAVLSGLFYRYTGSILAAMAGEVLGTGLIGSMASYPVMSLFVGDTALNWFFYTPSFVLGTLIGGSVGVIILVALKKNGQLQVLQEKLGTEIHTGKRANPTAC